MGFFEFLAEIFNSEKDIRFYNTGMKFMGSQEFSKAVFDFSEAIKIKPTEEKYHDALGKALYKAGMESKADVAFAIADDLKGLAIDPRDVKILCSLAGAFQSRRMFSVSQMYIKRAITIDPGNDQVYFLMGRASYLGNKIQEALKQYEKALELNPYCIGAYKGMRDVFSAQGKKTRQTEYEELLKIVKRVDKSPDDSTAHSDLGDTFRKYNNKKLAEKEYAEALRLNKKCENALLGMGLIKYNSGDYSESKKIFSRAVMLNKYNHVPHSYLGLIYKEDEDTKEEAAWELDLAKQLKGVESAENQSKAYVGIGDFFLSGEMIEDAEETYHIALKIDTENPEIYVKLALLHSKNKKIKEAMAHCEQAIKLAPETDIGYIGKGLVFLEIDELDNALSTFQQALTYANKNPEIHGYLGEVYKKKGLYKLADTEFRIKETIKSGVGDVI